MTHYADRMVIAQGSPIRALAKLLSDPDLISFGGGNPAEEAFPIPELIELSAQVLRDSGPRILQYGETEGMSAFKESALEHVIHPKGVKATTDEILTLTGSVQGFDLAAKVFLNAGDVVLAEGATFTGALQAYRLMQADVVGVEMDDEGVIIQDLEDKMKRYKPKLFYCIPTFQNPTGKTLSVQRRQKIAELASKYDVMVIEDDPYCDLRYRGEAVPPIKTFDGTGNVMMFNSFSKILAPGLRLGTVVGKSEVIEKMGICKQSAVGFPNGLAEAMADVFLRRGLLPGQIKKIVPIYQEHCDAMMDALHKYFPQGTKCIVPDGGMFLWVELPEGNTYDISDLQIKALKEAKVAFLPGAGFSTIPGQFKNVMRLNFSACTCKKIDIGMKRLGELLQA